MNQLANNNQKAFHYCSVASLLGIVSEGKFRLGNILFMNDYLEVAWFKNVCRSVLDSNYDKIVRSTHSVPSHSTFAPGMSLGSASSSVSAIHSEFHKRLEVYLSRQSFDHIYCGCFSLHEDDLSQWRGYADDGKGVAICFDLNVVRSANSNALSLRVDEVSYDEQQAKELAKRVILDRADRVTDVQSSLVQSTLTFADLRHRAPEFKNPKFAGEREVRLIAEEGLTGDVAKDLWMGDPTHGQDLPSEVAFYERRGRLIPYVTVVIPVAAIQGVWLGPRFGDQLDESALRYFLSKQGVEVRNRIHRSAASYR